MFRYEHRSQQPISKAAFLRRHGHSFLVGAMLVGFSLGMGMFGYSYFEGLSLTDSFLNASMILGGMGPVDQMKTEAGKIFAGAYALYSASPSSFWPACFSAPSPTVSCTASITDLRNRTTIEMHPAVVGNAYQQQQ